MSQITSVRPMADYKLEVVLANGSSVVLNLASRLKTLRFGMLANQEFFMKAVTDGSYIRWGDLVEISVAEVLQLVRS